MSFNPKRRLLLGASVLSLAGAGALGWRHFSNSHNRSRGVHSTRGYSTLATVVDTLIPADDHLGGLDMRIDQSMSDQMQASPPLMKRFERLIRTVEQLSLHSHRAAFNTLNVDQREALLIGMLDRDAPRQARDDLFKFRSAVFKLFYQNPAGQDTLGYLAPSRYGAYQAHKQWEQTSGF